MAIRSKTFTLSASNGNRSVIDLRQRFLASDWNVSPSVDSSTIRATIEFMAKTVTTLTSGQSAAVLVILGSYTAFADAEDWYRWRGPDRNGISIDTDWTDKWPEAGPPIAWRASVGTGYSSIVVSDGRAFTIGNEDDNDTVYCLNVENGKTIWSHSYSSPLEARFFDGGPTSTPTIDAEYVYTLGRQGELFCFHAADGKVRWSKNIQEETGARITAWGFSGSPSIHQDLLLLNVGEAGTVLNKHTGEVIWASGDRDAGYSTPLPVHRDGRWIALIGSAKYYLAVDIESGNELWRHRWLTRFGVNAADPIVVGDNMFISSGYNRGCALLNIGSDAPQEVWKSKEMQNQMNSCVLIDGHLYGIDGDTTSERRLKCLEYSTGEVKWSESGIGSGALMAADGKLIILSEDGKLIIAKATPKEFTPSAQAKILTGRCWTVPVLSNGRVYCRNSEGEVACADLREKR